MSTSSAITPKIAEQLIRLFNVVFNSSFMYGGNHPSTQKSIIPFVEMLKTVFSTVKSVSLIVNSNNLFLEELPVDKIINPRRILQQFEKSGIVSVTFEIGVSSDEVGLFISHVANSDKVTPVNELKEILKKHGASHVKINYIRFGKITDDQTVVDKELEGRLSDSSYSISSVKLNDEAVKELENILTLGKLLEKPNEVARVVSEVATDGNGQKIALNSLSAIRNTINQKENIPVELLLNAVYELKMDLAESIAIQKETGKLLAKVEPLQEEMDNLTCDVIVKLVKEEYGSGNVPIRRFAEIIRRMLPDINELKRVLPRLKRALLEAGMTVGDYLQLVRSLNVELESEKLATTLESAASGIGVSVEELVKAIKSQPDEAAKLLLMASEIQKGTKHDDTQLSFVLTEYIEKVSTSLALESQKINTTNGSEILRKMLTELERKLLDNLKSYGLNEEVIVKVSSLLSERFNSVYDNAAIRWVTEGIKSKTDLTPENLSEKLINMVGEISHLERIQQPLIEALVSRGFDKEQMEKLIKELAKRISSGKMFKLPPGILSANNMKFLLDREIRQRHRYHTPFSTMTITVEGLCFLKEFKQPNDKELSLIIPGLYSLVKSTLRDIDLVGVFPEGDEKKIFAILSMTDEKGAHIARERLLKKIESKRVKIGTREANLVLAVSVTSPIEGDEEDTNTYLRHLEENHRSEREEIKKRYS
ncbi:MAG: hypothetical protein N2053_05625 [Chitinispirillaceae bacterium]|nr:hypothetical protein [Chitinispirillaceae bacterium]